MSTSYASDIKFSTVSCGKGKGRLTICHWRHRPAVDLQLYSFSTVSWPTELYRKFTVDGSMEKWDPGVLAGLQKIVVSGKTYVPLGGPHGQSETGI